MFFYLSLPLSVPIMMIHLADVPQMDDLPLGFGLLVLVLVFHVHGVGAAIRAFHLYVPAALVHEQTRAPADGAFFQNIFFHLTLLLI